MSEPMNKTVSVQRIRASKSWCSFWFTN